MAHGLIRGNQFNSCYFVFYSDTGNGRVERSEMSEVSSQKLENRCQKTE